MTPDDAVRTLLRRPAAFRQYPSYAQQLQLLDDLARSHVDLIRREELGTSRGGRPIISYTIGNGSSKALWYGGPHANEVVGAATTVYLLERLVEDAGLREQLDWTMTVVACIDPDGAALNEGWLGGPYTLEHYHRNFYRPAMDECPDQDMPIDHGRVKWTPRLPEGRLLLALIDELRPSFLYGLHNHELGRAVCFLGGNAPWLAAPLTTLLVEMGFRPETANILDLADRPLSPGVFAMPDRTPGYQALDSSPHPDPSSLLPFGEMAQNYATRYGTISVVSEVPHWTPRASEETRPDSPSAASVVARTAERLSRYVDWQEHLMAEIEPWLRLDSPFRRAVTTTLPLLRETAMGMARAAEGMPADRRSSDAEAASTELMLGISVPQRYRGMILRLIDEELRVNGPNDRLSEARGRVEAEFRRYADELGRADLETYDLNRLVQLQTACGIVAQAAINAHH
jgi:hypothetical protein